MQGYKSRIFRSVKKAAKRLPCSRCKKRKLKKYFRIRTDKTHNFDYYNSTCKYCDAEVARAYYQKVKDDPEFKKKNQQRARAYTEKNLDQIRLRRDTPEFKKKKNEWELKRYHKKKDEINAKLREKRKTAGYKKYMKAYRKRNKAKIFKQEVITKKRFHEKNRDAVTDTYCINLMRAQGIEITPQTIEIKRTQILLSRLKDKVAGRDKK